MAQGYKKQPYDSRIPGLESDTAVPLRSPRRWNSVVSVRLAARTMLHDVQSSVCRLPGPPIADAVGSRCQRWLRGRHAWMGKQGREAAATESQPAKEVLSSWSSYAAAATSRGCRGRRLGIRPLPTIRMPFAMCVALGLVTSIRY